jgi:hypothetical protein
MESIVPNFDLNFSNNDEEILDDIEVVDWMLV